MALTDVDWSTLPQPEDDGAAAHLIGTMMPAISVPATTGGPVDVSRLKGLTIIYAYPMTGRPDVPLPDGWDMIPGARGCTPQSCAFRDHMAELNALGATSLFGLSTQSTAYQAEAAARLHLPFPLLSDEDLSLTHALRLPTMEVAGMTLIKRLTLILRDAEIVHVNYPVFPPDADVDRVIDWLQTET
ncbi:MAG: peroxiredoxin [Pseudomonadota bacterium]